MKNKMLAPSILSADFARLGEEINEVIKGGADVYRKYMDLLGGEV